uniref:C-type lectin domain-containing protein n=1 Tax=Pelusios castaneus TaxID=367368 RepID=A0A8C8RXY7_9SAUR
MSLANHSWVRLQCSETPTAGACQLMQTQRAWVLLSYHVPVLFSVQGQECPSAVLGPTCPDGWVGYRGKCYYFSGDQKNWASSQTGCSALNASLAGIDTQQDMDFMMRHWKVDHWIGLRRDQEKPWKWANTLWLLSCRFHIGGSGDCAYLSQSGISSLRCTNVKYWICSKPDVFTKKSFLL